MFLFLIKRIILLIFLINISSSFADQLVKEINVEGNKRVPSETILMFSEVDLEKSLNPIIYQVKFNGIKSDTLKKKYQKI